jgi:hypothetical protein
MLPPQNNNKNKEEKEREKEKEERLTAADLVNIKLSIILALQYPGVKDMPNIEESLLKSYGKVDRLLKEAGFETELKEEQRKKKNVGQ